MIPVEPGAIGENPALVIVDPQVDFLGGEVIVDTNRKRLAENINSLVQTARQSDVPIIWGKESHRADHADYGAEYYMSYGDHTIEHTEGEDYVDEIKVDSDQMEPAEYIVRKRRFDLFFRTDLDRLLDTYEVDTIILGGLTTHVCVHYTAHGAHNRDYRVRVVEECTADREDWKEIGLRMIEHIQPDSRISLEKILSSLEEYEGNEIVRTVKETGSVFGEDGVSH